VKVYNRKLSAAEVTTNYSAAFAPGQGVTDGLVYELRIDEGQGSLLRERALEQQSTLSYGSWSYVPNPRLGQLGSSALTQTVFCQGGYRFGFNGQERDDEVSGAGNSLTAMYWQYDARLGRRWNVDPKPNTSISMYATFANNPIWFSDPMGDTISINLFNQAKDSETFHNVANSAVSNQMDDGVFIVFAHSHSGGIEYTDADGNVKMAKSAEEFNNIISERSPEYKQALKEGKEIVLKLYSCNAAAEEYVARNGKVVKRDNTIAEKISMSLPGNSTVTAANGYVNFGTIKGKPSILGVRQTNENMPEGTEEGGFVTFRKGESIAKQKFSYNRKTGQSKKGPKKKLL
jgi:RHS repeat-associated protein